MGPIRNAAFQAATWHAQTDCLGVIDHAQATGLSVARVGSSLAGSPTAEPGGHIPVQRSCPARIASKRLALRIF